VRFTPISLLSGDVMYKVEWQENGKTYKKFFMNYDKAWNFLNSLYLDCLVVGSMLSLSEK
jgi:Na+/citrate or Na+/malate symporter